MLQYETISKLVEQAHVELARLSTDLGDEELERYDKMLVVIGTADRVIGTLKELRTTASFQIGIMAATKKTHT